MARGKRRRGQANVAQVQSLVDRMANLGVGGKRRRSRRPRATVANFGIPAGEGSFANVVRSNGRGRRRRGNNLGPSPKIGNGGQITITRCELFQPVVVKANADNGFAGYTCPIIPGTTYMLFLGKLAACYTRIRWESMQFDWRPAVGTTQSGIITYGTRLMDDTGSTGGTPNPPASRQVVSSLFPVNDHPVWQTAAPLVVSKKLLQSRQWYATSPSGGLPAAPFDSFDYAPGSLQIGAQVFTTADLFLGEIWVSYTATLDGSRSEN